MRDNKRQELHNAISDALTPLLDRQLRDVIRRIDYVSDVAVAAIEKIQPAQVDLTQELADDIVRKIHGPLTISREFSAWIADQGKHHDCLYTFMIGYGSDAGRGEMRLSGNGAMHLSLHDCNGAFLWRGTFVPPDFGES